MIPYTQRLSALLLPLMELVNTQLRAQTPLSEVKRQLQAQIDKAQAKALEYGYEAAEIDAALFAIVAWIDEQVMTSQHEQLVVWRLAPLQRHYFQTHNAGVEFYERLAQLSTEQVAAKEVYTIALLAGFKGQRGANSALGTQSEVQRLIDELTQQKALSAWTPEGGLFSTTGAWSHRRAFKQKKHHANLSLFVFIGIPVLILLAVYFYLDFSLAQQVSTLIKQVAL